ncbi:MAG: serine protease [Candidatus Zixiibacteriota bacterium]
MVIEAIKERALILTAYHNVKLQEDTIWVEFHEVYDGEEAVLLKFDEKRDVALLSVEQPPANIKKVDVGKSEGLRDWDKIWAIGWTVVRKWDLSQVFFKGFEGSNILFFPALGVRTSGAPLFDNRKGRLLGMIQREMGGNVGEALRSEVIREILDGWKEDISYSLRNKLSMVWHYHFFGEMLSYMAPRRWKFSNVTSLGLGLEFARKGKMSPHKCGLLYSSFKSEPIGDNPTGILSSTFLIPFWKYEPLFRIGGQYFGIGLACGLGFGAHSLEDGELLSGVIINRPGVKDDHNRLAMFVGAGLKHYLRKYFCVSLGWHLMGSTVQEFDIFYHGLYLTGELRLGL